MAVPRRGARPGRAGLPVVVALLLGTLLVGACTSPGPEPRPTSPAPEPSPTATAPTGLRIGVVLPAAAGEGEDPQVRQLEDTLQPLAEDPDRGVRDVRILTADARDFVPDLAELLLSRGTDLLCVVGQDAARLVEPLAERHPDRRFCAVPGEPGDRGANVTTVELRAEELGTVVGSVAADAADGRPVAAIVGGDRLAGDRFREGVRAGVTGTDVLSATPSSAAEARAAVEDALAADAGALVLDVGWDVADLLGLALAADVPVLAPTGAAGLVDGIEPLLTWHVRWDRLVDPVLTAALDPDRPPTASVGVGDDVFVLRPGDAVPSGTVAEAMRRARSSPPPGPRSSPRTPPEERPDTSPSPAPTSD